MNTIFPLASLGTRTLVVTLGSPVWPFPFQCQSSLPCLLPSYPELFSFAFLYTVTVCIPNEYTI